VEFVYQLLLLLFGTLASVSLDPNVDALVRDSDYMREHQWP